jgi:transcriptional regulator with XRE-family HTH domain
VRVTHTLEVVASAMNEFYREFGARVRDARGDRSQSELAAAAGLTRSAVANIELGRNRVTLEALDRLARALAVEPCRLLPVTAATTEASEERLRRSDRVAVERIRARAGL